MQRKDGERKFLTGWVALYHPQHWLKLGKAKGHRIQWPRGPKTFLKLSVLGEGITGSVPNLLSLAKQFRNLEYKHRTLGRPILAFGCWSNLRMKKGSSLTRWVGSLFSVAQQISLTCFFIFQVSIFLSEMPIYASFGSHSVWLPSSPGYCKGSNLLFIYRVLWSF